MASLNANYFNLRASYLFAEIKQRTKAFTHTHPGARLINLGIGDVTQPLPPRMPDRYAPGNWPALSASARSIPRRMSAGLTKAPVDQRIPERSRNVYVLPPSLTVGSATARSGTTL